MAIVGGGGNVGGASFSITGDASELERTLRDLRGEFNQTGESAAAAVKQITEQFDAALSAAAEFKKQFEETFSGLTLPTGNIEAFGQVFAKAASGIITPVQEVKKEVVELGQVFEETLSGLAVPKIDDSGIVAFGVKFKETSQEISQEVQSLQQGVLDTFERTPSGLILPPGMAEEAAKVREGLTEVGTASQEMGRSVEASSQQAEQGLNKLGGEVDRVKLLLARAFKAVRELDEESGEVEFHNPFIGIKDELADVIAQLGIFRSEIAALSGAAPIGRVIRTEETVKQLEALRAAALRVQETLGKPIVGEEFRQSVIEIQQLESEISILQGRIAKGFELPDVGNERLRVLNELLDEANKKAGLVRLPVIEPDISPFRLLSDELSKINSQIRSFESIEVRPGRVLKDEFQAEMDELLAKREELLEKLSEAAPEIAIEFTAPNLEQITGAIGEVENRLRDLTQFEVDPAFRTERMHTAIDALIAHMEQLHAKAREEMGIGNSAAQQFNDTLESLQRLNDGLANLRIQFGESIPADQQAKYESLRTSVQEIFQTLGQPVDIPAFTEGARSAEDLLRLIDLVSDAISEVGQGSRSAGEATATIENLTDAYSELIDKLSVEEPSAAITFLTQRAKELDAVINQLSGRRVGTAGFEEMERQAEAAKAEAELVKGALDELRSIAPKATELTGTEKRVAEAREIGKLRSELNLVTKEFGESDEAAIALRKRIEELGGSAKQALQKATGGVKELVNAEEAAAARVIDLKRRLQQLAETGRGGGTRAKELQREIESLQATIPKTGGVVGAFFNTFSNLTQKATTALAGFGLKASDVAIILGAGFAGGIAGAIQVVLQFGRVLLHAVEAVIKFGFEAAKLGAEIQTFRDRLEAGFGDGARIIEEFAQGSAANFGLTEKAATSLTGTIGNLFQSFGIGQSAAAQFSVDLAAAARIIQRTSFTTDTYEQVLTKLKGALTGNVEGLREYGIAVNEASLRDTLRAHGIATVTGELDAGQKALAAYLFITDQANDRQGAFAATSENLLTEQEKLSAAWEELKTTIGEDLVPLFKDLIEAGQETVRFIGSLYDAARSVVDPIVDLAEGFDKLNEAVSHFLGIPSLKEIIFGNKGEGQKAFEEFSENMGVVQDQIFALGGPTNIPFLDDLQTLGPTAGEQIDAFREKTDKLFKQFTEGKISADEFFTILAAGLDISPAEAQRLYEDFFNAIASEIPALEKYREELFNTSFAQEAAEEAARSHTESLEEQIKVLKGTLDVLKSVRDARERVTDAEEALAEAISDAADKAEDAQKRHADAIKERSKAIREALDRIKEVEAENTERIADAQERLKDAQEQAAESIQDAEERLSDARIDGAKRVQEAEKRLHDNRQKQLDQLLDAQLAIEKALREGDAEAFNRAQLELTRARRGEQLNEAQKSRAEAVEEAAERIKEAEEALAEAREDAAERVEDAEERLTETIEDARKRQIEAEERWAEVREQQNERVKEAVENLAKVEEEINERVQEAKEKVLEAQDELTEAIEEANDKLAELNAGFFITIDNLDNVNERIATLRSQLAALRAEGSGAILQPESAFIFQQHGGHYSAGRPYIVGEVGPELRIPGESGMTISNAQLMEVLREMAHGKGGGGVSQHVTVNQVANDPDATAFAVATRLLRGINN